MIFCLVIFVGMTLKFENVGLVFFKFQSMTIFVIRGDRRPETVPMPKTHCLIYYFWNSIDVEKFQLFKKISKCMM